MRISLATVGEVTPVTSNSTPAAWARRNLVQRPGRFRPPSVDCPTARHNFACLQGRFDAADSRLPASAQPACVPATDLWFYRMRSIGQMEKHDKKRAEGRTAFILAHGIGDAFVDRSVDLADVAAFLNRPD